MVDREDTDIPARGRGRSPDISRNFFSVTFPPDNLPPRIPGHFHQISLPNIPPRLGTIPLDIFLSILHSWQLSVTARGLHVVSFTDRGLINIKNELYPF